jgi:hypothetical protein
MKYKKIVPILVICIASIPGIASSAGHFSYSCPGPFEYQSIRGKSVTIYGHGIYKDMLFNIVY